MSRINGEVRSRASRPGPGLRDAPSEGTNIRLVYDVLREHAGRAVPPDEWAALAELVPGLEAAVVRLRERYGCEIHHRALLSEPGPRIRYA